MVVGKIRAYNLPNNLNISSDLIDAYSPQDLSSIGKYPNSNQLIVNNAIINAKSGLKEWSSISAPNRGKILRKFCSLIEKNHEELANLVVKETGKHKSMVSSEIESATEMGYLMASEGRRLFGRVTQSAIISKKVRYERFPMGICALIVASNTPVPNYAWKVFPALVAGNACILKPSEVTPFSSTYFIELAYKAGIPEKALQLIHGDFRVGEMLAKSDVDLISFTGSRKVAIEIQKANSHRVIKTCFELGGINSMVILEDAELNRVVESIFNSAFSNSGQRCAAASRIIIQENIYDKLKSSLINKIKSMYENSNECQDCTPILTEKSFKEFNSIIKEITNDNNIKIWRPKTINTKGFNVSPTILEGLELDSELSQTEIFAPLIVLFKCKDLEHGIKIANDTIYGLTSAIWTSDREKANYFVQNIETGMVTINGNTFGAEPNFPFGGFKQSGNGWRENGETVIEIYTNYKTIVENFYYET